MVNVSRFLKVQPELALTATTNKFISRFEYVESSAQNQGKQLTDMTLDEMDALWDDSKRLEREKRSVNMRIDKFLKVSRIIKRRTLANEACAKERVTINGRLPSQVQRLK